MKLGAGETVSETETWWVKLPEVPVTVTVKVPVAATPDAEKVRVLVVVAGLGLKAAVTPDGSPEAERATLPLKPFCGVMITIVLLPAPCTTVTPPAESAKFGTGVETGQLLTRLAAFTLPMPEAKSQPAEAPYAGLNALVEVDSSPTDAPSRKQFGPVQSTLISASVTS